MAESQSRYSIMEELNNRKIKEREKLANIERELDTKIYDVEKEIEGIKRREFGSGISANVDAMARIGYLYLRRGRWRGRQIIPASFVYAVRPVHPALRGLPVVRKRS